MYTHMYTYDNNATIDMVLLGRHRRQEGPALLPELPELHQLEPRLGLYSISLSLYIYIYIYMFIYIYIHI